MATELPNRNESWPRVTEFQRAYIRRSTTHFEYGNLLNAVNFRFIIRKYGNCKNMIYELKSHRNKEFIVRNHRNTSLIYNKYDKNNLKKNEKRET